jgi:hypothetical protein
MEYIPAISLLVAFLIIFALFLNKITSEQLAKIFSGKNFLLLASLILFLVLLIVHLFQNQTWTADVLKIIVGIFVGASASFSTSSEKSKKEGSSVDINESQFGDHAKLAGRDINETIDNMQGDIDQIKDSVINQYSTLQKMAIDLNQDGEQVSDYLINTIYDRFSQNRPERITDALQRVIDHWQSDGWQFKTITSDYNGIDGMIMLFARPSNDEKSKFSYFHGSQMEKLD